MNRRITDFNAGWSFKLGDPVGAHTSAFNDAEWRDLRLPHDWSVEASFDRQGGEGATGYLPGGIGWYRKHFVTAPGAADRRALLVFDGVYNHSRVWFNGTVLGNHPNGYAPFQFDLSEYLRPAGETNVLAVRVDRTRYCDSRWYPGSGIYRDVKLIEVSPLHIPVWGTYVTTPRVSNTAATVEVQTTVRNTSDRVAVFSLTTSLRDPDGRAAGRALDTPSLAAGSEGVFTQQISVDYPRLWGTGRTNLYRADSQLTVDGVEIDGVTMSFGIRTCRFDKDHGFFLNGEPTLIKGVCLHHDAGLVGAAVPKQVWERRLRKLKAAGCNAIRTAHNPPSSEFLDLCDAMGFLVQHEFFDEWERPKDKRTNFGQKQQDAITRSYSEDFIGHAEDDLKRTMLRDRNHPCIFMWSIGNEIEWCYPRYRHAAGYWDQGDDAAAACDYYFSDAPPHSQDEIKQRYDEAPPDSHDLGETAHRLARWTREMDATRPVTANLSIPSVSHRAGYTDAIDLVGYSYRACLYDYGHRLYGDKMILGTENWVQWHEWKSVLDREFVPGVFLWTGIDYLGEAAGKWPVKGSSSGMLDLAGFEKPSYHMMKSLWNAEPHVRLFTQTLEKSLYTHAAGGELMDREPGAWKRRKWGWHDVNPHWNYEVGQAVAVEAYTNCAAVELFLNGRSQGVRRLKDCDSRICTWAVEYEPGTLEVRGLEGDASAEYILETAGAPVALELATDRTELPAVHGEAAHIIAQLVDAEGRPVRTQEREVVFDLQGPLRLYGVDHGGVDNVQRFVSERLVTGRGRALLIVGATGEAGAATVTAGSEGLRSASIDIACVSPPRKLSHVMA